MDRDRLLQSARRSISQTVHSRIVPDLLRFGRSPQKIKAANENMSPNGAITGGDFDRFVQVLMHRPQAEAFAFVEQLRAKRISVDVLFNDLLGGAALTLGEMWCDDDASFGEVALAMSTLHQILRRHGSALADEMAQSPHDGSALIALVPGEAHMFGLAMVEEYFRAFRWRVISGFNMNEQEMLAAVRTEKPSIVGLSVGSSGNIESVRSLVMRLKKESSEPLPVLVGGPAIRLGKYTESDVNADATSSDARQAVEIAFDLAEVAR